MSSFPKSSTVDLLCPELEMLLCVHVSKLKDKSPNRITVTEKNFTCPLEKKNQSQEKFKGERVSQTSIEHGIGGIFYRIIGQYPLHCYMATTTSLY